MEQPRPPSGSADLVNMGNAYRQQEVVPKMCKSVSEYMYKAVLYG